VLSVAAEELANLYSAQGTVEKRFSASTPWSGAAVKSRFENGNACRTGLNSRCAVLFVDGVLIRMNETTLLEFKSGPAGGKRIPIRIDSGAAYFLSREPKRFPQIETPVVSAAVRGTEFVVEVLSNQTVISMIEGELVCSNAFGQLQVGRGEQAVTVAGAAPLRRILVRPWDAVQWALYYPAILDAVELARIGFPDAVSRLAFDQSLAAYKRGDLTAAFSTIDSLPDPKPLVIRLYQTALYLAVGQVSRTKEALISFDNSLATVPSAAQAPLRAIMYSQRSIIASINNYREEALALAQQAVNAEPQSAAAALAMSYAYQAQFNLPEARQWTEQAMRLQPDSATVFGRLAELQLGFGELNKAVRTVEEGLKLAPDDSRLLTVAGFAYLTRYQTKLARQFFDRALALDIGAGLPHLGRGLALIRENELAAGRRELEMAVHLEPTDSLMRSYLGKAFFEEKRDHLAATEYELAHELDPLDPTPYLYSAFHKLGNYRPVEALWDIEDSIKLNDNRAVYRSRLLLDQDQAVRSASLSQIFNQVGFEDAGRVEAIKSINRDYNNFSAHLLLAGSYFERPQLNQAVISEELVARLLSPVNINSVRGEASFNEYTSLFDRQRMQFFLLSEARTADNFIQGAPRVAMANERFALGVVYGARYLGGYRKNDDATLFAPGLLAQYQVTPSDTVSAETIQFHSEEGDTAIGYNPRLSDPDLRRELESFTQRVGWHHRFGPESHLLGQFLYLDRTLHLDDKSQPPPILAFPLENQKQREESKGLRGELQQIWDLPTLSMVAGGNLLDSSSEKSESRIYPNFGFQAASHADIPERARRAYAYSTLHLGHDADLTIGGNYSWLELSARSEPPYNNDTIQRDRFNPKAGLTIYPTDQITLRGSYLENFGGAGSIDLESIEPTQVAGFNQLFDDAPAARARLVAVGLDYKLPKSTYFGVELTSRRVCETFGYADNPIGNGSDATVFFDRQRTDKLARTYLYRVFNRRLTATVDYSYLDQEADNRHIQIGDSTIDESQTHRVRVGLNYFFPNGWFSSLIGTWRYQNLKDFEPQDDVVNGTRDFWIWDGTVGYQFPKRTGYVAVSFNNLFDRTFRYQPVGIDERFLPNFSMNVRFFINF